MIIITDPGEDVDDTFALMLASVSQKHPLCAVISANEDLTDEGIGLVACYARKLLNAMGRQDVPVYQGESLGKHAFLCKSSLNSDDIKPQNTNYLEAVRKIALTYPKVYLLSIAAMTSLACVKQADWFDPSQFEIYQMGGNLDAERPEYNLKCDIPAAREVLASRLHLITSAATFQEPMQVKEGSQILAQITNAAAKGNAAFQLLLENYRAFREKYGEKYGYYPYLSDALTFSALEGESFVTFSSKKIEILDNGCLISSEKGSVVEVSDSRVNGEKFMAYLAANLAKL